MKSGVGTRSSSQYRANNGFSFVSNQLGEAIRPNDGQVRAVFLSVLLLRKRFLKAQCAEARQPCAMTRIRGARHIVVMWLRETVPKRDIRDPVPHGPTERTDRASLLLMRAVAAMRWTRCAAITMRGGVLRNRDGSASIAPAERAFARRFFTQKTACAPMSTSVGSALHRLGVR